jgi:4-phospho-D-threonate 3-dehydrogenase / 4-phospho-D-erythronate 3-dehydrogenase
MAMADRRPLLALTLGDPSGVGPEIVLRAITRVEATALARYLLVGPARVITLAAQQYATGAVLVPLSAREARHVPEGGVGVLSISDATEAAFPVGRVCAESGAAAVAAVESAARLALEGAVDAIVTAPLNKEAMHLAGHRYPGHTEILGALCGRTATMLLVSPRLRVVHVSVHCSLAEAIRRVTRENVLAAIRTAHTAGRSLGFERPRVAVAGLNPHAGEGGMFGSEESEEIAPAIDHGQSEGIDATGPWPPDTLFLRASRGEFDVVVAMYHDQGHIPVKLFGLEGGVNVTLGLPIIRTSVDHGTAFDIAGRGIAQCESMLEAIRLAVQMVAARRAAGEAAG